MMRPLTLLVALALGIALALWLSDHVYADGPCVPVVRETPADSPAQRYATTARGVGRDLDVPADLIVRTIHVESRGDPEAVSPAGARGLMQVMVWLPGERWWEPYIAIRKGAGVLRQLFEATGDWMLATARYCGHASYNDLIWRCEGE